MSAIWNSGGCDVDRTGDNRSTNCSKATSAWANASRSVAATSANTCATDWSAPTCVRNTNVFTNIPTSASRVGSVRPAIGAPIRTSSTPASRATVIARAAWCTMNGVTPWCAAACVTALTVSGPSTVRTIFAWGSITTGRARSIGRSITSGAPARRSTQYAICAASTLSGSPASPKTRSCHNA